MKLEIKTKVDNVEKIITIEFEQYTDEIVRPLEDLRVMYKDEKINE